MLLKSTSLQSSENWNVWVKIWWSLMISLAANGSMIKL